jgi:peptidoglycan LD-endopeptidase CwlK
MINSRLIDDLTVEAQKVYCEFEKAMSNISVRYIITSTFRDQEMQDWLYAQGRTRPGPIVTHVKHSAHQDRIAWDIAIINKSRRVSWDVKADVNQDGTPDYLQAVQVGTNLGLICGGNYTGWKDWPHFNLNIAPWN